MTGPDKAHEVSATDRWPTGVATLVGLALGSLGGWWAGLVPAGLAVGLALGVGLDSILSNWLNDGSGV